MSELGHDLHSQFPDSAAILHALKTGDAHFRKLADRHHDLSQQIGRIEAGLDPATDNRLEALKKQRLALLDEVAGMIAQREGRS